MASLIDELVDILLQENDEYEKLINLSTEKTSTIVKNDIENMQRLVAQEQNVVDRVNVIDKKREATINDICKVLHVSPSDLTVKVLIDLLKKQPTEQKKLADAHRKLKKTLDQMVRVNERNKMLMKESLEILEFEMNLVKGLKMAPETNNYTKGAYNAQTTQSGLGAFDAKQ